MKTNVYIVTGFLGAGKTTLLKRILNFSDDLSKTVVLVNEFGEVGIDSALLKKSAAADIVELTSGCICCSLKTDMIQTLQILRHEYSPEHIVIEATGVADPLAIIETLSDRLLSDFFKLEKTITVVDTDFWEARESFGTVFKSQIAQADMILLNKIDTLDKKDIPGILKEIQAESSKGIVIPTLHCNIDPDLFWSRTEPEEKRTKNRSPFKIYDPETDLSSPVYDKGTTTAKEAGFISFSFETSKALDEDLFKEFLAALPLQLFRVKGPVRFPARTKMLNFVGGKSQWIEWPDTDSTCLAFIGWDVIEDLILKKLQQCLLRP